MAEDSVSDRDVLSVAKGAKGFTLDDDTCNL